MRDNSRQFKQRAAATLQALVLAALFLVAALSAAEPTAHAGSGTLAAGQSAVGTKG